VYKRQILLQIMMIVMSLSLSSSICYASTLTVGETGGLPGHRGLYLPVYLSSEPGEDVAGAQLDVVFDSTMLAVQDVIAGPAAAAAEKEVSFSHFAAGRVRIVITGFNQNVISDGVVAYTLFDILGSAPVGAETVSLSDVLLADPDGVEVPSTTVSGSIDILAATPGGFNGPGGILSGMAVFLVIGVWVIKTEKPCMKPSPY